MVEKENGTDDNNERNDWQNLRLKKATAEGNLTRVKNQLYAALNKPEVSEEDLLEIKEKLRYQFDEFIECLIQMLDAASKNEEIK